MTHIVDRRLNPRDKALKNRKRFMDLHKKQIKEAVRRTLDSGDVDMTKNNKKVRVNPTSEPTFGNNRKTGDKEYVLPGNKEFVPGDHIKKPEQGSGGQGPGQGEGSPDGEGEDSFEFLLTDEEFRDYVFEEMELPDFIKKQLKNVTQYETINSGYKNEGNPSQLDIVRSMKNAIGRKIGLKRPSLEEIQDLKTLLYFSGTPEEDRPAIRAEIERLEKRRKAIPWIDPFDVRYKNQVKVPKPHTQAVMFCVMDVSFSMGEDEKDVAKRFFVLLNMFLRRKYNNVHVVFIAHHAEAREVDEDEFFHSKISGGTVVSEALSLTKKIINERYKPEDWNIYIAQASDGDNFPNDETLTEQYIEDLLGIAQYYAYIETLSEYKKQWVQNGHSLDTTSLWKSFRKHIETNKNLALQRVPDKTSVWKVFSNLFHRTRADNAKIFGE